MSHSSQLVWWHVTHHFSYFFFLLLLWRCFRFDTSPFTRREVNVLSLFDTRVFKTHIRQLHELLCDRNRTAVRFYISFWPFIFFALRPFFLFFTFVDGIWNSFHQNMYLFDEVTVQCQNNVDNICFISSNTCCIRIQ